jgi:hypothetical protein
VVGDYRRGVAKPFVIVRAGEVGVLYSFGSIIGATGRRFPPDRALALCHAYQHSRPARGSTNFNPSAKKPRTFS